VPYADYRPEFTDVMDGAGRGFLDAFLLSHCVPLVPGLDDRLTAGARLAAVGCGTGHALVLLGRAYPKSTFVGYDIDDGALARGRAEAAGAGLTNVRFEACDAARLIVDEPFDAVFVFDAVHDQVDPARVLRRIHVALKPGAFFLMKEPHAADAREDNLANPMAPILYGCSTLHCLPISLAHGGAGLGTMFAEGLACELLTGAGFSQIAVHSVPGDPADAVYVSRKAER
jgi:SAM-dependent methyltransferase